MKAIIITIPILAIVVGLVACSGEPPATTSVHILYDVTDEHLSKPDTGQVFDLFNLDENSETGGEFRFMDITDVSLNKAKEIRLNTSSRWLSNEFEREDQLKKFETGIKEIITEAIKNNNREKTFSSVYIPIVLELERLKASHANRRILLVFSDLMENTQELSYYRNGDFIRLKEDPESVKKQLEKSGKADSLSGIEIRFIYQPPDTKSDKRFREVSNLYKQMFEEKGAKVSVSASIE